MRTFGICVIAALLVLPACKKKDEGKQPNKKKVIKKKTPDPKGNVNKDPPKSKGDAKLIARGAYLAGLAGCGACHTPMKGGMPDMTRGFAGGLDVQEAFGTWRSPNITQDMKTGIGGWTDQEIMDAIRTGKRKDGTMMYPIMPYMLYNKLSNGDAKALVAFLRTIKAIEQQVAGNTDLKLPKPPKPIPAKGDAPDTKNRVAHGAYLATVMHCVMCHTPMTEKGPDMSKAFAGGFKMDIPKNFEKLMGSGYLYSSNITQDKKTGIGTWTEDEILASFTKFVKKDGKPILGLMNMYRGAWPTMPLDDARAVATFIKSIKAIKHKVPASKFKPAPPPPNHMGGQKPTGDGHKHGSGMGGGKGGGGSKSAGGKNKK